MAIMLCETGGRAVAATDATLVADVLSGDRAAFAELYHRRSRLIRAICFDTTHDLDTAADLTQEVFLRAYTKLRELRDPQCFSSWLVGISRHVCREWRRLRRLRRPTPLDGADALQAPIPDPQDERLRLLRDALPKLPERQRLCIQAFYLEDLDAEQARSVLGLTKTTFYRELAEGRRRLAGLLRQQEVHP
jgi:RNA polymerase sigma-70 factor (ECF subfamily)